MNEIKLKSMTGFGRSHAKIAPFGMMSLELKSINHKALETLVHLPEGFSAIEPLIKKEVESRVKRGRVTCVLHVSAGQSKRVFVNGEVLKEYIVSLKQIAGKFKIKGDLTIDALIHLPGVFSLVENRSIDDTAQPELKKLVRLALDGLVKTREQEGKALHVYLKQRIIKIASNLGVIKKRFKIALHARLAQLPQEDERVSFLKDTDITEEIERLDFHIKNFKNKLLSSEPVGKELDFIAQELQREANTMAAKSFDLIVSEKVIEVKGLIEKIREQLQNIE